MNTEMLPRVKQVEPMSDYRLSLSFTNGEKRQFAVKPYLNYTVYRSLAQWEIFKQVMVSNGTVCWGKDGHIDFDPDTLYLESQIVAE
ncbi:DUF2442 domain-containing protein [Larkinella sp. GY13]|uniref:DUF2442 domain-containing protein n=1 Tax=Larkinella sp. GY13 TaxID=3453720 RepID=UPI003EEFC48A